MADMCPNCGDCFLQEHDLALHGYGCSPTAATEFGRKPFIVGQSNEQQSAKLQQSWSHALAGAAKG
jgi:hypothetical protein